MKKEDWLFTYPLEPCLSSQSPFRMGWVVAALPGPSCFPKTFLKHTWEPALDGGQMLSSLSRLHTGGVFFSLLCQVLPFLLRSC